MARLLCIIHEVTRVLKLVRNIDVKQYYGTKYHYKLTSLQQKE